jgi:amidase
MIDTGVLNEDERIELVEGDIVMMSAKGYAHDYIKNRMLAFFADYDILATPTVIAPPYDIRQRHLMEVAGTKFDDFFAYLMLTSIITVTTCPAISVPCGFTASGLPVGLQLIAKPRDNAGALAAAATFEALHDHASKLPIEPRSDACHFS